MYAGRVVAFCIAAMAWALPALAQNVPSSVQPGRERELFTTPPAPLSRPAGPLIDLRPAAAPAAAQKIKLRLARIIVEGSTVYSAEAFTPLYVDIIGRQVTAADIYALAAKIGSKYGHDGYLVAQAFVVPQAVNAKAAVIRIRVVEGYIERVEWPEAARRYRDLFSPCIAQIVAERPARTRTIERCLLLASDLPGLKFYSTIKAGKSKDGGAVLVVTMTEKPFEALARVDNRGIPGRGPWEDLFAVTANNLLGLHESVTLSYASAFDTNELQYFSGSYHQALTAEGLAFNFNAYYSKGTPLLAALSVLNFRGNSEGAEGGLSYPVIRSREQNLSVSALGFAEHAFSDILGFTNSNDELRGARLRANYDQVDMWLGTVGQTQIISTFSQGFDGLGSSGNQNPLASVAGGRVDFSKIDGTVNRTQRLAYGFSLYGAALAQWSPTALLVPEQCSYGGQYFGRAFDAFELAGDRCWAVLGEMRYDLAIPYNPLTTTQLYSFIDHGDVTRVSPSASTPGHTSGSSAGGGLRLAWKRELTSPIDNMHLDLQAAKALDGRDDKDWRFFMILTARY